MSSRSPVNGVGYDKSLLAAAPAISKRDKQEGYDPDLLEQGKPATPAPGRTTPSHPGPLSPSQNKYAGSDESPKAAALPIDRAAATPSAKKGGRTKWIIIAVVLLVVIIGVGVGVGVGVGAKRNNNSSSSSGIVSAPNTAATVPIITGEGSTKPNGDATSSNTPAPSETPVDGGDNSPRPPNGSSSGTTTKQGSI